ncbi:MAG: TonB-dependent receptor [Candidatus Abyssobacteria bacterium SURF_5]|uniref:TonB-dependent receptor n=1 Tax=Abyssobacteria bacterium (strain SURF_5) TaxID=2093360 RepID=A0A3A4NK35_ABYX5|nr:MAG: TonB-dependent receptor [Candidatus Abyssubacteria bacterium SURF_5]
MNVHLNQWRIQRRHGEMGRRNIGIFSLFILFLFHLSAYSQETDYVAPGEYFDMYTLGEIVVTGEREGVEGVTTVRRVTAEEIRNKGARTLSEALELLPGIVIRVGAEGTPRVDIRGLRSRHVTLLLNGIPINSTNDGQFDPSLIPVENIAEIKVSYSNHSILYGDGGLAGVINIITRKGTEGIHGMVSAEAGEGDHYLERFNVLGGQEKWSFFLSGSIFDRHAFPLSDDFDDTPVEDGDFRENSDFERDNFFGNFVYAPNDEWEFGVTLNYLQGEFGKPPSVIDDPADIFANRARFERVDDFEGISGQFAVRYNAPGPLDVRSWAFFNQLDQETNRYDDDHYDTITRRGNFHANEETFVSGVAVQPRYDLGRAGQITLALNARTEEFETDGFEIERVGGVDTPVPFDDDRELDVYSVALEYEVFPIEQWAVVLGYNHNWLDKEEGEDDDAGAWLIGSYYDFPTNTRLKGSVSKQVRFPSIRQLYGVGEGNIDLTTEESINYEAGIEQALPWNTWASFTAFYLDVEDYIEKIPPDDIFTNNDEYEFAGFEVAAENRTIENLLVKLSYTYLDSQDKSPGSERDELQYRPEHKLALETRYYFDFGLSAYLSILRVADQVVYSRTEPLVKDDFDDYTVVNAKLEQAFLDNLLRVYVGVENLFDEEYEESYALPRPGRFIYAGGRLVF